jgi:hypothetical protein
MTVTNQLSSSCDILSSYDIASFFSYAEVEQPQHALNQVNHPAFSKQYFPVVESTCSFYAFYLPGSKNYQMLQVTTRVDLPENEPAVNWNQLWDNAISQANQIVPGLGDGAFYSNGSLTFKNGNAVVTLSISTVNLQVDPGPDQALEIETRLAQAALTHWRN